MPRPLYFSPRAASDLKSIPKRSQKDILSGLESLAAAASLPPPPKVKKLKGFHDHYRLRAGEYRAIFKIQENAFYVLRVIARKDLERILSRL